MAILHARAQRRDDTVGRQGRQAHSTSGGRQIDHQALGTVKAKYVLGDRSRQRQSQQRALAVGMQGNVFQSCTARGVRRCNGMRGEPQGQGQGQRCPQLPVGTAPELETEMVVQAVIPGVSRLEGTLCPLRLHFNNN